MSDRIPGEVLTQSAELRPPESNSVSNENDSSAPPVRERIPQALRDRAAARSAAGEQTKPKKRKPAASGARILAAGFSVAAGVGLVGAMAATAAAANQPQPTPVPSPVQRVVIIEQAAPVPVVAGLPATVPAPATSTTTSTPNTIPATAPDPQPMPTVRVVEVAPAPTPVTTSEGS